MNNSAFSGVQILFLASLIIIGTTAVSNELILNNDNKTNYKLDTLEEMIDDTFNEISNYFNVKTILGKYYCNEKIFYIGKIIILLKPYFDINFDISNLHILLSNDEKTVILQKNDKTEFVSSYDVFEHPNWNNLSYGFYSVLIILDQDNSIKENNIINENTDMIYVILNISDYFNFGKADEIKISLIPSSGNLQTFTLKAPLATSKIVYLY